MIADVGLLLLVSRPELPDYPHSDSLGLGTGTTEPAAACPGLPCRRARAIMMLRSDAVIFKFAVTDRTVTVALCCVGRTYASPYGLADFPPKLVHYLTFYDF